MANEGRPGRVVRFGLETGAISLGVTLGFLADDYRDYLSDRSLETESLPQVIEDLRLDREDMAPMVLQTQALAESTRWITNRAASDRLVADSLAMAIDSLQATPVFWYEPATTAYSDAFLSDRRAIFAAGELTGHSLDLRGYVIELLALNEELADQVEAYLVR